jgi:carbon-monoxide dehydrogenase large subunit
VGGGFGPKFIFYPEEVAIPLAAKLLGRPVKWIEDRFESFTATTQERDQYWDVEMALAADGRLLGIRGSVIHDHGAYTPYGITLPFNSATNLIGPYILPSYRLELRLCLTNKVPATPTRGAGRPQGTFVMERLLDRGAAVLGIDRAELRTRNLIPAERLPYATGVATRDGGIMTYDSGDYPRTQAMALECSGWRDFPARQAAARAAGRYIGIGLANYVEGSGRGPFESATVRIGPSGQAVVMTGATAQGQGVKTMLAQLCADQLGLPLSAIEVIAGDTAATALGMGAFASRQAVTAGSAAHLAAGDVRRKLLAAAGSLLEAAPADLEIVDGHIAIRGVPGGGTTVGAVARALYGAPGYAIPAGLTPGLEASALFEPTAITYCNGAHVAEVEVDVETGFVRLTRYVVVHDCGRLINPTIVEGQIRGGVVHGIGSALFEHMRFDDAGQPLTNSYADYLLPSAPEMPAIEIHHLESPTPLNPLGVKGAGESGTIPAAAAVIAAVEDALRPWPVHLSDLPLTPPQLLRAIVAAREAQSP